VNFDVSSSTNMSTYSEYFNVLTQPALLRFMTVDLHRQNTLESAATSLTVWSLHTTSSGNVASAPRQLSVSAVYLS